ncbi:MAG: rRNA maturation RNase YbeY [Prevotella sp.]|nr:rRNA maturation RNase YbeY [Bacteroides sp.]MCM1366255.1 rRNA maturation RNase YbeY [Prevotella sp.]MCM1436340.1 rRNA maturation RNase YbeY [Prevotella sp.]
MVNFQTGNVEMPNVDRQTVGDWLSEVASSHGFDFGTVNYRFCDDDEILESNRQFVGHDYFTDIITFDYTRNGRVNGDVLISLDTVTSNSQLMKVTFDQELMRVIAHGVLHLCGINDKSPEERIVMENAENKALELWNTKYAK